MWNSLLLVSHTEPCRLRAPCGHLAMNLGEPITIFLLKPPTNNSGVFVSNLTSQEERLQKPMSEPLCVEGDANLADAVEPERVLDQSLVVKEPPVEENPWLQMPIHAWLESIDDSLFMLQYCEQIVSNFDSLKQIHDIYFRDGSSIDAQFYKAAGITKLGHKRIIEKWFREKCSSEQAAGSCPKQLK